MYIRRIVVLSFSLLASVDGFIQWLSATTRTRILRPFPATSSVQDLPSASKTSPDYGTTTGPVDSQSSFFFCPFESFGVPTEDMIEKKKRPLLLYLPGLDGSGLTPFIQYPDLANHFVLRCLSIPLSDRSTFIDLTNLVLDELKSHENNDVFIMGESFGGLLAMSVALSEELGENVKGVVLVNPATSFTRTIWSKIGPYLVKLPDPLYQLSMVPIGMMLVDQGQVGSIMNQALQQVSPRLSSSPPPLLTPLQKAFYEAALPALMSKMEMLPPATLEWRLKKWLTLGSSVVNHKLSKVSLPVYVIAGTVDRLLPSYQEGKRLKEEIPACEVFFAEKKGHSGTLDHRTNLTQLLLDWSPVQQLVSISS